MKKSLSGLLFRYFYGKVDFTDYSNALDTLGYVVSTYNSKTNTFDIDKDNQYIKEFVKEYYTMKESVEARYNEIRDYSNSLEGKARPLVRKLTSIKTMRELEKLYPKFKKFEDAFTDRTNISMIYVYYDIQEEEKSKQTSFNE